MLASFEDEASYNGISQRSLSLRNLRVDQQGDNRSEQSRDALSVASTTSSKLMEFMKQTLDLEDEIFRPCAPQRRRPSAGDSVTSQASVKSVAVTVIQEATTFVVAHWKILLFGQFISLMMSTAGASQATMHFDCGLSAPLFSSGVFFILLSLHLVPVYAKGLEIRTRVANTKERAEHVEEDWSAPLTRRGEEEVYIWFLCIFPVQTAPWRYAVIAFLDVQACYFTILAFKYTPMTSVTLFAALSVPSAMVLSKLFLGRSFGCVHLLGVFMCMTGVFYNVLADYHVDEAPAAGQGISHYPNRLFGDILAITGGVLYGVVDVVAESALKTDHGDVTEFLGMIGFFATLMSLVQGWFTEQDMVVELYTGGECSLPKTGALLLLYVIASALEYIGIAHFLARSEATLLNLSILTDPALWSVLFTICAQSLVPPPLFWTALVFVLGGLVVYEMAPSPLIKQETGSTLLHDEFDAASDEVYTQDKLGPMT